MSGRQRHIRKKRALDEDSGGEEAGEPAQHEETSMYVRGNTPLNLLCVPVLQPF